MTLTATADGRASCSIDTRWVGWQSEDRRVEMRQARVVGSEFGNGWAALGHSYRHVLTLEGLADFLTSGGHALVERSVAETGFPDIAEPHPAHYSGRSGFVDPALLDPGAERRAPTPKVRMAVLRRDNRRCRVCGRHPDDNVDIVLNVHHVRPWARGGATEMANLITLCHTCHSGLEPHFDPSLFDYLDPYDGTAILKCFDDEVANYRRVLELS
ncbi:HNH endonuclease [Sphingomonas hominis]|nr:HNH endonuclease [Sphingomonas hominis]